MDSSARLIQAIHVCLKPGDHLAIRKYHEEGLIILLAQKAEEALMEIQPITNASSEYYVFLHWARTATDAMFSAWLDGLRDSKDFNMKITWNRNADTSYTKVMNVLEVTGLIEYWSYDETECVVKLNCDPVLVAKFSEIAMVLLESETTREEAEVILGLGLRSYLNGIRKMDAAAMAREFAAAWH